MNGEMVPWDDAKIHIGSHALHYGTGVFEGIRAYETPRGAGIVRLDDHVLRLANSANLYSMPLPYTPSEIKMAIWATLTANDLDACYIRPIAYRGYKQLGLYPLNCPVDVAILVWPWGAYLGDEAIENGIAATISPWRRFSADVMPPEAKATGQYLNSVLAKLEASARGFEEAILLNAEGTLAEGSGENIFVVKDGALLTPRLSDSILHGITRDTVLRMARDLGIEVREQAITVEDLHAADEIFMTGTAAEITPIHSVDEAQIGKPGAVTKSIQAAYFATVHGEATQWSDCMSYRPPTHEVGETDTLQTAG